MKDSFQQTAKLVEKLVKTIQDNESKRVLKRLGRAIDALPENVMIDADLLFLLEHTRSVIDGWDYFSKHPQEVRDAVRED